MSGRFWIGLILIVFGTGFMLHEVDIWNFYDILSLWWPVIFIIVGLIQLINFKYSRGIGLIFITIGGLLLANQHFNIGIENFWPVIMIAIGIMFLFSQFKFGRTRHTKDTVDLFSLFSGAEVVCQSENFKGGHVAAVFGGAEIDLRNVILSHEGTSLDLLAAFGGVTLIVPEHIHVQVSGIPVLGGWENKTRKRLSKEETKDQQVLRVNCLTAFGGVEIKN